LARSAEETAANLAEHMNRIRGGMEGFNQLNLGLGNRAAIAGAAFFEPGLREAGKLAGLGNDALNKADPGGKGLVDAINGIHDFAAGFFGAAMAILSGKDPNQAAFDARQEAERMREQAKLDAMKAAGEESELWSNFMLGAQNIPVGKPARPIKP
jgi:hypothetical protein